MEVSDRFPVLGFIINTGGKPLFEVALTTDPGLLRSDRRGERTSGNFYSTRGQGPLRADRGEALWLASAELGRFVGQPKLFYALATFSDASRAQGDIQFLPTEASPWVSLRGLTGRGGRRATIGPIRTRGNRGGNAYGGAAPETLEWAGDAPRPGAEPVHSPSADTTPATSMPAETKPKIIVPAAGLDYDDGFGPMPQKSAKAAQPFEYNVITPLYTPSNRQEAEQLLAEFQRRRERWRAGVPDTRIFPHSAICRFRITEADGEYIGTGFYIGPDRILTCAHNVATAKSITVIPGLNDLQKPAEPFGSFKVGPSDWVVHPKYRRESQDFDLAVLRVKTPPPHGEFFDILEELNQSLPSSIIVCGYAAETVSEDRQHLDGDAIRKLSDNMECFEYNLQTEGGSSGSPVFYLWGREDEELKMSVLETRIVGVHTSIGWDEERQTFSRTLNEGCRLTQAKIDWIYSAFGSSYAQGASATPFVAKAKAPGVARPHSVEEITADPAEEEGYEEESAMISHAQSAGECSDAFCPTSPAATAGTAHFSLSEFQCRDGTPVPERFRGNTQQVMENLEIFRAAVDDKPITINSGYRSCAYNSTLEGAAGKSRHLCGQAADIRVTDMSPLQVRDTIEQLIHEGRMLQGGLGLYDTFVHYDVRGHRARWDKRRRSQASSLADPGEIAPDYSQVHSTLDALRMFWDWLRRQLSFRIGVSDTSFFPHSAIAKLRLLDGQGRLLGEGSGFYVGRNKLVTAGHCLVNDDGSRVRGVEVIPGLHGKKEPFGGGSVGIGGLHPHAKYNPAPAHYDPSFDIGVIIGAPDAPHGAFFEMEELRMSPQTGIITCGYAAVGVDPLVQHMDVDTIRDVPNGTFTYAAQVREGSSGGPVFYALDEQTIRVVGLNVTAFDAHQNQGLRLTDPMIAWINSI
jgi:V8-like Glu-specific endopeptidase